MTITPEVKEEIKLAEPVAATQVQTETKVPEESVGDRNWRQFRQEREKDRKEKIAAEQRAAESEEKAAAMKAAMEAVLSKPSTQINQEEPQEETESSRIKRLVKEEMEQEREKDRQQRQQYEKSQLKTNLVKAYPDIDTICSSENLDYLEFHYPEVVAGYKGTDDTFDKWANLYKAAKRFIPNTNSKKDEKRIENNLAKPQSMSVPGSTHTGDHAPTQLTEQRRMDNWNRMQKVIKGI